MANRFGRNQRRKMRQQAELLTKQNASLGIDLTDLKTKFLQQGAELRAREQEIDEAKEVVGIYSSLFAPKNTKIMHQQDFIRVDPESGIGQPLSFGESIEPSMLRMTRQLVNLNVMLAETQFDPLNGGLHTTVTFAGGKWAYAMDWNAVAVTPKNMLAERIATELAWVIANDLKNNQGRRW
ncbi:MAG: hypothetical protein Q7S87_04805 [Agitococcus sp.]|nr:hypothetical protein [Agitococcus sp.]